MTEKAWIKATLVTPAYKTNVFIITYIHQLANCGQTLEIDMCDF